MSRYTSSQPRRCPPASMMGREKRSITLRVGRINSSSSQLASSVRPSSSLQRTAKASGSRKWPAMASTRASNVASSAVRRRSSPTSCMKRSFTRRTRPSRSNNNTPLSTESRTRAQLHFRLAAALFGGAQRGNVFHGNVPATLLPVNVPRPSAEAQAHQVLAGQLGFQRRSRLAAPSGSPPRDNRLTRRRGKQILQLHTAQPCRLQAQGLASGATGFANGSLWVQHQNPFTAGFEHRAIRAFHL